MKSPVFGACSPPAVPLIHLQLLLPQPPPVAFMMTELAPARCASLGEKPKARPLAATYALLPAGIAIGLGHSSKSVAHLLFLLARFSLRSCLNLLLKTWLRVWPLCSLSFSRWSTRTRFPPPAPPPFVFQLIPALMREAACQWRLSPSEGCISTALGHRRQQYCILWVNEQPHVAPGFEADPIQVRDLDNIAPQVPGKDHSDFPIKGLPSRALQASFRILQLHPGPRAKAADRMGSQSKAPTSGFPPPPKRLGLPMANSKARTGLPLSKRSSELPASEESAFSSEQT